MAERDPIDTAALDLARAFVRDLEAGRILVTALRAGDEAVGRLDVTWRLAAGGPPGDGDRAPDVVPQPAPIAAGTRRGCPECGSGHVETTNDGQTCADCLADF